ncbi:MAG: sialidase family protein [Victivallaceae bacterium]|nr:sialidase family protein [Victivallaceae bacterium]
MVDDTLLKKVWAPVRTGTPFDSPHMCMMKMPDGQLRSYGAAIHGYEDFTFVVQKSDDCGMSWRTEVVRNRTPGACVQSPWSGDCLVLLRRNSWKYDAPPPQMLENQYQSVVANLPSDGIWLFRSKEGPDGNFTSRKIMDDAIHLQRLPLALKHRKRWIVPGEEKIDGFTHPVLLISDDDGENWKKQVLSYPPLHEIAWPHKGYRWRQPGVEPVVAEHADGTLQMLLRTSVDFHYQCFSDDHGDTWSEPEPSPFYSVATMPNLLTLSDGRLLAIWNNTTPLPELDHALQPDLDEDGRNGVWEDVFTNRDALHAAISEDSGRSWYGFRELVLNGIRNASDYRTRGGHYVMFDRSVHQNQAIELPDNKVLVGYGQHSECWGFLVFDLGWLAERSRADNFNEGLAEWSIHQFVKSHSGGFQGGGHCSWNRRPGAALVPACDGSFREALQIARHPDSRLLYEKEGAVWNFPAFRKGRICLKLTLQKGSPGMQIASCDRWFNPTDPLVWALAPFVLTLDAAGRINGMPMLRPGETAEMILTYDQDAGTIAVACADAEAAFPMARPVPGLISYLHLQSIAESADPFGVLLDHVEMEGLI